MKKILFIRFSSIGDIVLTSPVVRCVKKKFPSAEIHFLTKKPYFEILASNPYINKVITIEKSPYEVAKLLRAENYDFVIDLHKNLRSMLTCTILMKPSASFDKLNFKKWLLVNANVNKLPQIHLVDRYFKAVKCLNVENDGLGLDFFIPPKDEVSISTLPEAFSNGFFCLVLGANHFTKKIPIEKVIEICNTSSKPIVLVGGKNEFEEGEKVKNEATNDVFNACGKFNICQSASIVRQSEMVFTPDTGMMHIAAALGKKIVSIWGSTVPAFGMYPYMPGKEELFKIIEVKGLPCRPCSKIGFDACPKGHFRCMKDWEVGEILKW